MSGPRFDPVPGGSRPAPTAARPKGADEAFAPRAGAAAPADQAAARRAADERQRELVLDLGQVALDVAGFVDPTPVSDGLNAIISAGRGDAWGALISGASMLPYIGDAAKVGKLGRYAETVAKAVELAKVDPGFARAARPVIEKIRGALDMVPLDRLPSAVREPLANLKRAADDFAALKPGAGTPGGAPPTGGGGPGGPSGPQPKGPGGPDPDLEGLAFRRDLPLHLAGPHGFKGSKLHGTHNLDNALAELRTKGATHTLTPTGTPGVHTLDYRYTNPTTGAVKEGTKTVYDPKVIDDASMLGKAQAAGEEAWKKFRADPSQTEFPIRQDGVNFRVYINRDSQGTPFIGNVHPVP